MKNSSAKKKKQCEIEGCQRPFFGKNQKSNPPEEIMKIGEIEKNVAFPVRAGKFPPTLEKMMVGDSILVSADNEKEARSIRNAVAYSICRYGQRNNKKFAARKILNSVRIWRME